MEKSLKTREKRIRRYRQFLSFVLIIPANGIVYAPSAVFVVMRFGVGVWTVENVLKTSRLSASYSEDQETIT